MDYIIVNNVLTFGAVLGQVFVAGAFMLSFTKYDKYLVRYIGKHGILFAFIVAVTAMTGSLYYSDVVLFTPCRLCWYQRIFMYPQVFLLGLALVRGVKDVIPYSLILAILGIPISIYHYFIQMNQHAVGTDNCAIAGGASCSEAYFLHLGYITIAMLALTAFAMIITCMRYALRYSRKN